MFYRYSQISGHLRATTQVLATLPQGMTASAKPATSADIVTYTPQIPKIQVNVTNNMLKI